MTWRGAETGMLSVADLAELRALSSRYAIAADERDLAALQSCFTNDGLIRMRSGGDRVQEYRGSAGLAEIVALLGKFRLTLHEVSTWSLVGPNPQPTAVVYGSAHHISERDDAISDFVMHIRYCDRYARNGGGSWCFKQRDARSLFTERRTVRLPL